MARYANASERAIEDTYIKRTNELKTVRGGTKGALRGEGDCLVGLLSILVERERSSQISYRTDLNSISSTTANAHDLPPKPPKKIKLITLRRRKKEEETHTEGDEYPLPLDHMRHSSIHVGYPAFGNCELSIEKVNRAVEGSYQNAE